MGHYIKYKDTINSVKVVQKMANMRTNYEISKKQLEVDLLNHQIFLHIHH